MLLLGRYTGQKINIGNDISITICKVNLVTGEVLLGFDAPTDIIIDREEISRRRKINPWNEPEYKNLD